MKTILTRTCLLNLSICILQLLLFSEVKAQQGISQNSAGGLGSSPNASSNISVSLHTGTNSANIPLWTHQCNDASLPISLGYTATGVKVSDMSSWVGLGWNVSAGGFITREIRGLPDDVFKVDRKISTLTSGSSTVVQTFDNVGYLYSGTIAKQVFDKNVNDTDFDKEILANNNKDLEPDLFRFQFGEFSGSFMFDENGTPQLSNQSKLSISYEKTSSDFYPIPSVMGVVPI